jgi:hypothetical protein
LGLTCGGLNLLGIGQRLLIGGSLLLLSRSSLRSLLRSLRRLALLVTLVCVYTTYSRRG